VSTGERVCGDIGREGKRGYGRVATSVFGFLSAVLIGARVLRHGRHNPESLLPR